MKIELNIEGPNRGWVVDKFSIGDKAYLKVSYIPHENFDKFYPNGVFSYVDQICGWTGTEEKYLKGEPTTWAHLGGWPLPTLTCEEAKARIEKKKGQDFQNFKDYFCNSPFEDYIFVMPEHRRQGLAEKLILEAVRFYGERGWDFYLSNLRSKPSESLKVKLIEKYGLRYRLPKYDPGKRRYYFPSSFSVHEKL